MSEETRKSGGLETHELQRGYEAAVLEFNLATVPLLMALTRRLQPSAVDVVREEAARATVVEARRKVWAAYSPA